MMFSRPCVWTSASETPRPLTRRSMMPTAVFMLVSLTADSWPGSALALSVIDVPPARSMPRRGVVCPDQNMPPVSATMAIRMSARARPGRLCPPPAFGPSSVLPPVVSPCPTAARRVRDGHEVCVGTIPADVEPFGGAHAGGRARSPVAITSRRSRRRSCRPSPPRSRPRPRPALRQVGLGRVLGRDVGGAGQRGGVVRDDGLRVRGLVAVVVAVDDPVVLGVLEDRADRVLGVDGVHARGDLEENGLVGDLLDGGVHPPIVRTPVPGCISSRICAACCCFFLAERVIRNMAPMRTMKGRRVTMLTGRVSFARSRRTRGLIFGVGAPTGKGGIGGV